jgi:DNA-binding NarL/FixJ family response regulator
MTAVSKRSNVSSLPGARRDGPMTLLVAVFDAEFAALVERACTEHEIDIVGEAENAAQAVHRANRLKPDVCLIDRDIPGGGIAAAWEMRARLPLTKIVLIADESSDDELFEALRAGVDGFLFKDMNLERLPFALLDVRAGQAALPRNRTARLLTGFRVSTPSWRSIAADGARGRLTTREWEVLELLGQELSTNEIASRLVLTQSAVRCHISSAVRKLGAGSRDDAVRLLREGAA